MRASFAFASLLLLAACGGGGGGSTSLPPPTTSEGYLLAEEVRRIVGQAVAEASARQSPAVIAVVDRVGNVLAVYKMPGSPDAVSIASGIASDGLETPVPSVPATAAAISKAVTGAFLSSNGNAFTTRTASQIIQEHFDPDESQQPSGPLYGVQFSQLSCSDVNRQVGDGDRGPKRSPLGLSGDPGGIPLYKNGVLVGGIGIESDGLYTVDRTITDVDEAPEELVAVAGSHGFAAPDDIRGNRITADGRTFRFVDSQALRTDPAAAPPPPPAGFLLVDGYSTLLLRFGSRFGDVSSGIRADAGAFASRQGWILVDAANQNRFPPRASFDNAISAAEVQAMLEEALDLAHRARGQIRRPLGSTAEVSISVVDTRGDILGFVRTADAPLFGIDVAVQKARTAMFFSLPGAGTLLRAAPPALYAGSGQASSVAAYADALDAFLGRPALDGSIAWTARAVGNVHRPFFPDGVDGTPHGPLSKPHAEWSPFNVGLQLDLVVNQLLRSVALGDTSEGCAGRPAFNVANPPDPQIRELRNGIQIFPGGVPIYRGAQLVGAIGVSGDGVDQDDMVAALAIVKAAQRTGATFGHAAASMRSDQLTPMGTRLRYIQCPQSPFNGSTEQNVCAGL
jgi:uncharacterized protein GlcG (DUF336 family)